MPGLGDAQAGIMQNGQDYSVMDALLHFLTTSKTNRGSGRELLESSAFSD